MGYYWDFRKVSEGAIIEKCYARETAQAFLRNWEVNVQSPYLPSRLRLQTQKTSAIQMGTHVCSRQTLSEADISWCVKCNTKLLTVPSLPALQKSSFVLVTILDFTKTSHLNDVVVIREKYIYFFNFNKKYFDYIQCTYVLYFVIADGFTNLGIISILVAKPW